MKVALARRGSRRFKEISAVMCAALLVACFTSRSAAAA
jgi:hypothetical protein